MTNADKLELQGLLKQFMRKHDVQENFTIAIDSTSETIDIKSDEQIDDIDCSDVYVKNKLLTCIKNCYSAYKYNQSMHIDIDCNKGFVFVAFTDKQDTNVDELLSTNKMLQESVQRLEDSLLYLENQYDDLVISHDTLIEMYKATQEDYDTLKEKYEELLSDYDALEIDFADSEKNTEYLTMILDNCFGRRDY